MECKIIQQWIDLDLDNLITEDQRLALDDHLTTCQDCRAYQLEARKMDSQLHDHFGPMETNLKSSKIMRKIKPPRKTGMIAASLLILLGLTFNNQLFALLSSFPLVGDLLDYFEENEGTGYAKEHGYPVHDMMFQTEDLTLFVKDYYVDKHDATCKYAVKIGDDFVFPDLITIEGNGEKSWKANFSPSNQGFLSTKDPWSDSTGFPGLLLHERHEDYTMTITVGKKEYVINDVVFTYDKPDYEVKIIHINQTVMTSDGPVEFQKIEVHPAHMYLHLVGDEGDLPQIDCLVNGERLIEYGYHTFHPYESEAQVLKYSSSIFYDQVTSLAFEFEYAPSAYGQVGRVQGQDFDLDISSYLYSYEDEDLYQIDSIRHSENALSFDITRKTMKTPGSFPLIFIETYFGFEPIDKEPPLSDEDRYARVPYFVLFDWFGLNIDKLDLEGTEYVDYTYLQHQKSWLYSLAELRDLLDAYSVKSVDLDDHFDYDVFISLREIELVLERDLNKDEWLDEQLTEEEKEAFQVYLYEEYGIVTPYHKLFSHTVGGLSEGVQYTSIDSMLYPYMTYTIEDTEDDLILYKSEYREKEVFVIEVNLDDN